MIKIPSNYKGYKVKIDNKHKYFATTDTKKKTVIINKAKSLKAGGKAELLDTWRHEKMHINYPNMKEKNVESHLKHKEDSNRDMEDLSIKGLV